VRHVQGARYVDVWNERELRPVIEGDTAMIAITIGPRDIAVVTQTRK